MKYSNIRCTEICILIIIDQVNILVNFNMDGITWFNFT